MSIRVIKVIRAIISIVGKGYAALIKNRINISFSTE